MSLPGDACARGPLRRASVAARLQNRPRADLGTTWHADGGLPQLFRPVGAQIGGAGRCRSTGSRRGFGYAHQRAYRALEGQMGHRLIPAKSLLSLRREPQDEAISERGASSSRSWQPSSNGWTSARRTARRRDPTPGAQQAKRSPITHCRAPARYRQWSSMPRHGLALSRSPAVGGCARRGPHHRGQEAHALAQPSRGICGLRPLS